MIAQRREVVDWSTVAGVELAYHTNKYVHDHTQPRAQHKTQNNKQKREGEEKGSEGKGKAGKKK